MTDRSMWQKAVRGGKLGFATIWGSSDKPDQPANKNVTKIGAEAFWPTTIDKESYKAARVLRSFCKDGVYEETSQQSQDTTLHQRVVKKIPIAIIRNAKGLAIFTTMRSGLWYSGAGGSGILIARTADGGWSPPSGILLHTAATGLLVGMDICDCVIVLNTQEAVDAFAKWRLTLGGALTAVAGPLGIMGLADPGPYKDLAPILTYIRSRGFHAGAQIDGTVIAERSEENQTYYGYRYSASEIISGKVRNPPTELRTLWQTLKAAQGDSDADPTALPTEPSPADLDVVHSDYVFGVPDREDPDPFGVLALEKEGLQIREAGTRTAVPNEVFEFRPNPTSPIFDTYNTRTFEKDKSDSRRGSWKDKHDSRRSSYMEKPDSKRSSWRNSSPTIGSLDRSKHVTMDISTQTDFGDPPTPGISDFARALKMDKNNLPSTPSGLPSTPPSLPQTPPPLASKSSFAIGASTGAKSPKVIPQGIDNPKERTTGRPVSASASTTIVGWSRMNDITPVHDFPGSMAAKDELRVLPGPDPLAPKQDVDPIRKAAQGGEDEELDEEDDDDGDDDDDDDDEEEEEEEAVIIEEVQQAARPQVVFKPRVVTIPRHLRPNVPQRNPSRVQRPTSTQSLLGDDTTSIDDASMTSIRSSSTSREGRQRNGSVTSNTSFHSRRRSTSAHSVKLEEQIRASDAESAHNALPHRPTTESDEAPTAAGASESESALSTGNATGSLSPKKIPKELTGENTSVPALSISAPASKDTVIPVPGLAASPLLVKKDIRLPSGIATLDETLASTAENAPAQISAKKTAAIGTSLSLATDSASPRKTHAPAVIDATASLSPTKGPAPATVDTSGPARTTLKAKPSNGVHAPSTSAAGPAVRKSAPSSTSSVASTSQLIKTSTTTNSKPAVATSQPKLARPVASSTATPVPALAKAKPARTNSVNQKPAALPSQKENSVRTTNDSVVPTSPKVDRTPAPSPPTVPSSASKSASVSQPSAPAAISPRPLSIISKPQTVSPPEKEVAPTFIPIPAVDEIDVPPPPSPSDTKPTAPRISLMSMKFSLDDDDKSDNDDD